MTFKKILAVAEGRPVLVIVLATVVSATAFVLLQKAIIGSAGIDISRELGQETEAGYYFGDYTVQVNHLIEHGSLISEGKVQNRYPPLYPYLIYIAFRLSAFGGLNLQGVLVFLTALTNFFSALLLYRIALLMKVRPALALMSSLLFLSHPYVLWEYTKVMSVNPYMTVLFASLWLLLKVQQKEDGRSWISYLGIGALLGTGMLIRPIALMVPLVFLVLMALKGGFRPRNMLHMALLLLTALLVITPWQYANRSRGQHILLSSDRTISIRDSFQFLEDGRGLADLKMDPEVKELVQRMGSAPYESKGEFLEVFFRELAGNPGPMIRLYLIKAGRSWYASIDRHPREEWIKGIISVFYLLLSLPGMIYFGRMGEKRDFFRAYILLFFYFWLMTVLVVSMVRYMIPVFGLMPLLIPAGIQKLIDNKKNTTGLT